MAKLKSPFFSFGATGRLGKALTVARRLTGPVWLLRGRPTDPKSPAQQEWRHMYQKGVALWHALSENEILEWERAGTRRHMTGFAWFMSQCLRPNPGLYLPLQGGVMTGDIDMDGHAITALPAPVNPNDAARKTDLYSPPTLHRVRGFLSVRQDQFLNGKIGRVQLDAVSYDTASGGKTDTWQEGVGDAGSNATTIIDIDPTTGTGFVTAMRRALVSWDAGASSGFIQSIDSATQVTIAKNIGADFTPGDTYTIMKAHYEVPTAGIWQIFGLIGIHGTNIVANEQYNGGVSVNGYQVIGSMFHSAATWPMSIVLADVLHLDADDIVALTFQSFSGTDNIDLMGNGTGESTHLILSLLEPDP